MIVETSYARRQISNWGSIVRKFIPRVRTIGIVRTGDASGLRPWASIRSNPDEIGFQRSSASRADKIGDGLAISRADAPASNGNNEPARSCSGRRFALTERQPVIRIDGDHMD